MLRREVYARVAARRAELGFAKPRPKLTVFHPDQWMRIAQHRTVESVFRSPPSTFLAEGLQERSTSGGSATLAIQESIDMLLRSAGIGLPTEHPMVQRMHKTPRFLSHEYSAPFIFDSSSAAPHLSAGSLVDIDQNSGFYATITVPKSIVLFCSC
jgi:hypothetical protein